MSRTQILEDMTKLQARRARMSLRLSPRADLNEKERKEVEEYVKDADLALDKLNEKLKKWDAENGTPPAQKTEVPHVEDKSPKKRMTSKNNEFLKKMKQDLDNRQYKEIADIFNDKGIDAALAFLDEIQKGKKKANTTAKIEKKKERGELNVFGSRKGSQSYTISNVVLQHPTVSIDVHATLAGVGTDRVRGHYRWMENHGWERGTNKVNGKEVIIDADRS
jgi:predicted transcriptional regulator